MNHQPDEACITFLTKHHYLKNPSPAEFIKKYNYRIPLDEFICYCVGLIDYKRSVQCIRILKKIPTEKITTMFIEWFNPSSPHTQSIQFWVNSGVCLKRLFFINEDQLNFFRSSFIYDPSSEQYFRLSNLMNFIKLNEINPQGEKIYSSPKRNHLYKKELNVNPERISDKRKRDFKKSINHLLRRHNIDGFIELHYPNIFKEVYNL